jgi:hypothetical protein
MENFSEASNMHVTKVIMTKNFIRRDKGYTHLKTKIDYPPKMELNSVFGNFCVVLLLYGTLSGIQMLSGVQASIASVDSNGAYNKLTVKITDQVPRQLCQQTLDTLEVR